MPVGTFLLLVHFGRHLRPAMYQIVQEIVSSHARVSEDGADFDIRKKGVVALASRLMSRKPKPKIKKAPKHMESGVVRRWVRVWVVT